MSKLNGVETVPHDLYRTPHEPIAELIPYLRDDGIQTFADPCDGDGDMVRHLESFGLKCVYRGDIQRGQDALARGDYNGAGAIISNIPYTRLYMHELMEHFLHVGPQSWLLLDHAWSASQWSGPFLDHASDVIPVKRITWFEGTESTETRSHCWYRFDLKHSGGPRMLPWNDQRRPVASRRCKQCGGKFAPPLPSARFCSSECRQQSWRERLVGADVAPGRGMNDRARPDRRANHRRITNMSEQIERNTTSRPPVHWLVRGRSAGPMPYLDGVVGDDGYYVVTPHISEYNSWYSVRAGGDAIGIAFDVDDAMEIAERHASGTAR